MKKDEPIVIAQIMGKWIGGGVEAVVMNYYRHIDRTKIQFDFICDEDSTNIPYNEIEKLGGRVIIVPPYQHIFAYLKKLKQIFKENKYKIVHSHINALSVFPLYAAKCAGVPVRIAHSHSTSNKKEWKKTLMKNMLRPFSKVFATDYMCCSELAGRWLFGNKTYDEGKVYLLNNAIDVEKFAYNEDVRKAKRKELEIADDTFVIGHIGRFVAQKNHTFLIDIFNEVHKEKENSVLLLVGQGPLENEIKEKVNRLGLSDSVKFLGQRDDVSELYQAFDLFLLPSLYEGLPVVGVEAQAAGLLCVLSSDMTKETKILESLEFLPLKQSARDWANIIVERKKKYKRCVTKKEISSKCFNIEIEKIKLENYYLNNNKIKVCNVVSALKSGGAENMIYNYSKEFDSDKYEFHLLYQYNPSQKKLKEFEDIGFKTQKIFPKRYNIIKNYFQTKKYLIENKIDILHAHMTIANFIPLLAAKRGGIKVRISHSHESINNEGNFLKKIIRYILKKMCNCYSTVNIACGKKAGNYLFGKSKYIILNNAIDLDRYKYCNKIRSIMRNKYGLTNDDILVGHIGRFIDVKNHRFIIDIAEKIVRNNNRFKFMLIGSGILEKDIKKLVCEKNLEKNIIFTGEVSNVNEYYNAMDIFVLPSKREGLPFVLIEAQANGLKCLFSNTIDKNSIIVKENCKVLELEEKKWVSELEKIDKDYKRNRDITLNFDNMSLNIKNEYKKLERIYEENIYV